MNDKDKKVADALERIRKLAEANNKTYERFQHAKKIGIFPKSMTYSDYLEYYRDHIAPFEGDK